MAQSKTKFVRLCVSVTKKQEDHLKKEAKAQFASVSGVVRALIFLDMIKVKR